MWLSLSLALFSDTAHASASDNDLSRGATLYRVCQAEMRLINLPSLTDATQSDLLNGSFCVGYINGFVASLPAQNSICIDGQPMAALVKAYVDYLAKYPDFLGQERSLGLGMALKDAFPCSAHGSPNADSAM